MWQPSHYFELCFYEALFFSSQWSWQHNKVSLVNTVEKNLHLAVKTSNTFMVMFKKTLWFSVAALWIAIACFFKILDIALDKANRSERASKCSAVVFPHMSTSQETGAVHISAAPAGVSSSVQTAGIDQWQPAKPSRQRSLPWWNQPKWGRRGVGSRCCVRDMRVCVCDVSEEEGVFVFGSRHRSCWRFKLNRVGLSLCSVHPLIQWTHLTFSYSRPLWLTQPNL